MLFLQIMNEPIEQFRAILKQSGNSLTRTRQAVFVALHFQESQTMHELIDRCAAIDRASIYRTITLFEHLGVVQRVHVGWKYKLELTDVFATHHHHLACTRCGKVVPLPENVAIEAQLIKLATSQKFAMHDHRVEIRGLCSECQKI